jgi:hypothetical protein
MRVLVACEFSGRVRDAFAAQGHDAWSCDLAPTETPGNHFEGDVIEVLYHSPQLGGWDLLIAHPPCQYLSYAARGLPTWDSADRREKRAAAVAFARKLWNAPIGRVCIENPRGELNHALGPATQTIQPWMFGHRESKRTCLWLRNLPPLEWGGHPHLFLQSAGRRVPRPEPVSFNKRGHPEYAFMRNHGHGRTPEAREARRKLRSRTFEGVAQAMAEQWDSLDD